MADSKITKRATKENPMATATESKTRAIGTVKVMADGKIKLVMTKPTARCFSSWVTATLTTPAAAG